MSEPDPTPEHGLPPEALALPDDFWESPLPPVVTEVPVFDDDASSEMAELDLAVDLSVPGDGVDDEAVAPVSAPVEPPSDLSVWAPAATGDAGAPEDPSPWVSAVASPPPADAAEEQPPVVAADVAVDPWAGVWADDLPANANAKAEPDAPVPEPPANRTVAAMWDEDAGVPTAVRPDADVAAEPATPSDPVPDHPPVDRSLPAVPAESGDADAVADPSLWFWGEHATDDPHGQEASGDRPADLAATEVWDDDLDDMDAVHPVPGTVGTTSVAPLRRWRERWEGNGARVAAVVVLFVAVAAVAAFLGRPDSPGSGPIELAGPTETTV